MTEPNWDQIRAEVIGFLVDLLRLDTTNPPGNEILAADYLAGVLRAAGFEPIVLESAPGRGNIVARLPGTGEEAPLLLMCHTDVVPAEPEFWAHPPFAGEVADGYVWGRGAVDMKDIVATFLELMLLFKRRAGDGERPLRRDLIFMATADEERGGHMGAGFLVEKHPDLIRAEFALNEGGGDTTKVGDRLYTTCQTAEKGLARFQLVARGEPGHASIPREDNAVVRLAEAVVGIGRSALPYHLTETVSRYISTVAAGQPEPIRAAMLKLLDEATFDEGLAALPLPAFQKRRLVAMTHNTAAPTILNAGSKINVFPSVATARVDGRILPGCGHEMFRAELEPFLGEAIEFTFTDQGAPLEASLESPLYDTIQDVMATVSPESTVVPDLITGGTDAKHIVRLGTKVYGFVPRRYEGDALLSLAHAHDERISRENLLYGTQVLYQVIDRFCGRPER
ncbi:MAG: M20/M25/M40 family metallo-hydrolase [Ardenticatenaceae bacterium]|nr:M20/M25/M40 family metallo-hydrolase [Ardenticatenaceae bacterium]